MHGEKRAFQNRLGLAYSRKEIYHFCFVLLCIGGQMPSTSPRGAYIRRSNLTEGFFALRFWGLLFGGAYTWGGLFSEFYGIAQPRSRSSLSSFSRHERELWKRELDCSPGNFANDTTM